MLQTIFLIILLPLAKCQSIDPWEFESVVDFVEIIADTERKLLDSLVDKDSASAISDTLGRMQKADQIITTLTQTIGPLENFFPMIDHIRRFIAFDHKVVNMLETVDICMEHIDKLYETYVELSTEKNALNEKQLNNWINASISDEPHHLLDTLTKMFLTVMGSKTLQHKTLFHDIASELEDIKYEDLCGFELSMQQRVDYIFTIMQLYQFKAFVITVYAETLNSILTKKIDKSVYNKREADTALRIVQFMTATESAMLTLADFRKVMACDAKEQTPETYTSFKQLFSYILISLADTKRDRTCAHSCSDVKNVDPWRCDPKTSYCPARPCFGLLNDCSKIDKSTVCELPAESNRRYEWFQQDNNKKYYGQVTDCERYGSKAVLRVADTFTGSDGKWCNVCSCKCTEIKADSTATRFVSFMPQLADIANGMVMTGIKIFESEHMIQMQIKQGKLMLRGHIDASTNQWKETQKLRYENRYSYNGQYNKYNEKIKRWVYVVPSEEYIAMNNDVKFIFIDDIVLEKDYVMTGARWNFFHDKSSNRQGFQIEIHATKYDFVNGFLDPSDSHWVTPQNMSIRDGEFYGRDRKLYDLKKPDDSLKAPYNRLSVHPNSAIEFTSTDLDQDAGQHTVPYFDTQKVEMFPPVASNGLSVYYRGKEDYGGFIGLALNTVDLSDRFSIGMSIAIKKYEKDYSDFLLYSYT